MCVFLVSKCVDTCVSILYIHMILLRLIKEW